MTNPILPGGSANSQIINDIIATQDVTIGDVQTLQPTNSSSTAPIGYQALQVAFAAKITGNPLDDGRYEWVEVTRYSASANPVDRFEPEVLQPRGSNTLDTGADPASEEPLFHILNPAVELNARTDVKVGSIVRLTPLVARIDEQGLSTQEHIFQAPSVHPIRAFKILEDLIPNKDPLQEVQVGTEKSQRREIRGMFFDENGLVDEDGYQITHQFFQEDETQRFNESEVALSHGLFKGSLGMDSTYRPGTTGWAVWVEPAWTNSEETPPVKEGQYQIVEVGAGRIYNYVADAEGFDIPNNSTGTVSLHWLNTIQGIGRRSPELADSQYDVELTNVSGKTIEIGDTGQMFWDQTEYTWKVLLGSNEQDDMPIGSVIQWVGTVANIPAKWARMDGVANAAGSGIDMVSMFSRGRDAVTAADNTLFGANNHDHGGSTDNYTSLLEAYDAGHKNNVWWVEENHAHGINADDNIPEYKKLHYIEKIS